MALWRVTPSWSSGRCRSQECSDDIVVLHITTLSELPSLSFASLSIAYPFLGEVGQRVPQDLVKLLDMNFPSTSRSQKVRILLRVPLRQIQCSLDFQRLILVLQDLEAKIEFPLKSTRCRPQRPSAAVRLSPFNCRKNHPACW